MNLKIRKREKILNRMSRCKGLCPVTVVSSEKAKHMDILIIIYSSPTVSAVFTYRSHFVRQPRPTQTHAIYIIYYTRIILYCIITTPPVLCFSFRIVRGDFANDVEYSSGGIRLNIIALSALERL